jgi:hypothetical protein
VDPVVQHQEREMGSPVSARDRIQPRTETVPSTSLMVSIRLRTPRCASRWLIGTLAWPGGRSPSAPAAPANAPSAPAKPADWIRSLVTPANLSEQAGLPAS